MNCILFRNFWLVYNHHVCQIIDLCELKGDACKKAHEIIDNFADRGLRSLGVARQVRFLTAYDLNIYYMFKYVTGDEFFLKTELAFFGQ